MSFLTFGDAGAIDTETLGLVTAARVEWLRSRDLAITGDGATPLFYVNPREGKYPVQPLYEDANLPPTVGIAVLDYNKDGWMDIAVTHAGAPGLTLWRYVEGPNHVGRRF